MTNQLMRNTLFDCQNAPVILNDGLISQAGDEWAYGKYQNSVAANQVGRQLLRRGTNVGLVELTSEEWKSKISNICFY